MTHTSDKLYNELHLEPALPSSRPVDPPPSCGACGLCRHGVVHPCDDCARDRGVDSPASFADVCPECREARDNAREAFDGRGQSLEVSLGGQVYEIEAPVDIFHLQRAYPLYSDELASIGLIAFGPVEVAKNNLAGCGLAPCSDCGMQIGGEGGLCAGCRDALLDDQERNAA